MNAIPADYDELPLGSAERAIARLAEQANLDTWAGGSHALVLAERAIAMGLPHAQELMDAVSATYAASSGKPSPDHTAWECAECGQVYLGREEADNCCRLDADYD